MTQSTAPSHISDTTVDVNGRTYAAPRRPTVVIIVDGFDPAYLEQTAYPLKRLYQKLGALKARRANWELPPACGKAAEPSA